WQAEAPGKVFLEGQSNLGLSGKYLVVSGLVFRNGYTPTSTVISFRTGDDALANHSRVTQCVIDNYSRPERYDSDFWVHMYGKHNTFDHNSLIGKRNRGVTFAVRLNTEASQENGHIIEYNYFGPRQVLASNGGETLRIGTSHYSRTNSNSIVRNNYFDQCDGELEIISNKSGGNTFQNNVFYRCKGTLTMRHGQNTLVENNYFLGEGKPNTGGIRVINEYQTVRNNYLNGLTGYRFRGPLVIMNGVPNSPINRYNQVVDAVVENNLMVDCDNVQLCAGSDEERSAIPTGSRFANNVFMSQRNPTPFVVYDDISGITFENNLINEDVAPPQEAGFTQIAYSLSKNEEGLLLPSPEVLSQIGFENPALPVSKEATGASYYPKAEAEIAFASGKTIDVAPGTNTLLDALATSGPGDVLQLQNGGEYLLTKDLVAVHPVSIVAPAGDKATIRSSRPVILTIENEGSLALNNLAFDGSKSPDQPGNSVVSTSKYSMNRNYRLIVENCEIRDLDVNHSFHFLTVYRSTMADEVKLSNSTFTNVTGSILSMARETDDLGMYNVERVNISDCRFEKIGGSVAHIYRGGTDESTFGPIVNVQSSEFVEVGKDKRNKTGNSLRFHGVQLLEMEGCTWEDSAPLGLHLTNGEPRTNIRESLFTRSGLIEFNRLGFNAINVDFKL
ncbi:MAG TPA: alginate lyase, partial [Cytophagales bacterium]|nr:alginate lyase [Cytophagales bacterium]